MPSSVIRHYSYDAQRAELSVTFVSGRLYIYSGVPPGIYDRMRKAHSRGSFFNRFIRDHFPMRRVA